MHRTRGLLRRIGRVSTRVVLVLEVALWARRLPRLAVLGDGDVRLGGRRGGLAACGIRQLLPPSSFKSPPTRPGTGICSEDQLTEVVANEAEGTGHDGHQHLYLSSAHLSCSNWPSLLPPQAH